MAGVHQLPLLGLGTNADTQHAFKRHSCRLVTGMWVIINKPQGQFSFCLNVIWAQLHDTKMKKVIKFFTLLILVLAELCSFFLSSFSLVWTLTVLFDSKLSSMEILEGMRPYIPAYIPVFYLLLTFSGHFFLFQDTVPWLQCSQSLISLLDPTLLYLCL